MRSSHRWVCHAISPQFLLYNIEAPSQLSAGPPPPTPRAPREFGAFHLNPKTPMHRFLYTVLGVMVVWQISPLIVLLAAALLCLIMMIRMFIPP